MGKTLGPEVGRWECQFTMMAGNDNQKRRVTVSQRLGFCLNSCEAFDRNGHSFQAARRNHPGMHGVCLMRTGEWRAINHPHIKLFSVSSSTETRRSVRSVR